MRDRIDGLIASGNLDAAIAAVAEMLDRQQQECCSDVAWAYRKRAQIRFMQNQFETAINDAWQALQSAKRAHDAVETAEAENTLGILLAEEGRLAEAVQHLEHSYLLHRDAGSDRLATVLNNIGNTCLIMEDAERALDYFRRALTAARERASPDGPTRQLEGTALSNVGRTYQKLGRPDEAVRYLQESVDLFAAAGMETLRVHTLAKLAAAREDTEQYGEAERLYREALASVEARHDDTWVYELHGSLGTLLAGQERYDEATPHLEAAIRGIEGSTSSFALPHWRRSYSTALEKRGEKEAALTELARAFTELDRVSEQRMEDRLHQAMARLELERLEQEKESYRRENEELSAALAEVETLRQELETRNAQLAELVVRDPLTGAYNRRWFFSRVGSEIERARRYGHPLTLAMIDLDRFKELNDRYGHPVGDDVLVRFTNLIMQNTRSSDSVVRYGGEEFAVIMPETTHDEGRRTCEKLRSVIAGIDWSATGIERPVTFSAGVAALEDGDELASLLERADEHLYEAKNAGRNRVMPRPQTDA